MFIRSIEQVKSGEGITWHHHWVSLKHISPHMPVAVMASEDQRFLLHHGFDYDAIEKAAKRNMQGGKRKLGASTITQQTAKNVFLWPGRSWVRKGFEAYFTALIELIWSKQRIMEVYLNVAETGRGLFGVGAACETYWDTSPRRLSRDRAVSLAISLPSPVRYAPNTSRTAFLRRRHAQVMKLITQLSYPEWVTAVSNR